MSECGGCQGLGSHRRWCREVVGLLAAHYGPMATELKRMGDSVGPNDCALSNALWGASARMTELAKRFIKETPSATQ